VTFTPEMYEQIRAGAQRSAARIVPLVHDLVRPSTVLDVGCGEGWFAREFAKLGCQVVGLDESVADEHVGFVSPANRGGVLFRCHDLATVSMAVSPDELSDIAVCLEVAEHLTEEHAEPLVGFLTRAAPVVLFSAAIPGQGGHGHLNEQWPGYWADLFLARGYAARDCFRRALWNDESIEPWYRQNLLLYARVGHPALTDPLPDELDAYRSELIRPAALVHPVVWEHRRQRP
jgi:SAM-dependent methyltransferase